MEIYADKGVFRPGETITLTVVCESACRALVSVTSLERTIGEYTFDCLAGENTAELPAVNCAFGGFGVLCRSNAGGEARCVFDVQEGRKAFRYGFLSDFAPGDGDGSDVLCMAKHHINAVQFYDWSYRHDDLVAASDEYRDMMGKHNSLPVILAKIASCRARGMLSLGYGAVYAASRDYAEKYPEQRLYAGAEPITFIDTFSIMNLRSAWAEHIADEYRRAVSLGFDGIHMDTYGFPKTALDSEGRTVHLEEDFPRIIRHTRAALPTKTLVFNNVGAWPMERTMREAVDAVYIEVWPPYDRYHHLKNLILSAKESGKSVVMAAYPAAFRTAGEREALYSQEILACVFAAHGATQLWFGEENAAVTQGYYADYSRLTEEAERTLRAYDDFFVRYEELFFDDELCDVSMTHFLGENREYRCSLPASADGEPGKLWLILREKPGRKLISVINLCQEDSDRWAEAHRECAVQTDVGFDVQFFGKIQKIFTASPDREGGDLREVEYRTIETPRGAEVHFTLPTLGRFAFVLLETEEN